MSPFVFNGNNNGSAAFVGRVHGYVLAWGFAPFWIGDDRQGLEALNIPPAGGFNFENRGGLYIDNSSPTPLPSVRPVTLPWSGDVWIMNGTGVGDQATNVVNIKLVPLCEPSPSP